MGFEEQLTKLCFRGTLHYFPTVSATLFLSRPLLLEQEVVP